MSIAQTLLGESAGIERQHVDIHIRINSLALVFGVPLLLFFIIMGAIVSDRLFTRAQEIHVAAPTVQANLTTPQPIVNATIRPADIPVIIQVPAQAAPVINIPCQDAPRVAITMPDGKGGEARVVEKIVEKPVERVVYVYADAATRDKAKFTLDDIFVSAEKFLVRYCARAGKDAALEGRKWLDLWKSRVAERGGGDEQQLFQEALLEKRGGFDVAKATVAEAAEVCRLLLRLRDAKLAVPELFKSAITPDRLVTFKEFLDTKD